MKKPAFRSALAFVFLALSIPAAADAESHTKSKEIVIIRPEQLPAAARVAGQALFLHSDNAGSTYLYVEQQDGALLSIFDVTDPASIKLTSTVPLEVSGVFDVERSLGDDAELVRYRNGNRAAILDLRKVKKPVLHDAAVLAESTQIQTLGDSALLTTRQKPLNSVPLAHDVRIIDTSHSDTPVLLATINQVEHQLSREDTGTTFFLGTEGLTVVRRLSVEKDYKVHQVQMGGN